MCCRMVCTGGRTILSLCLAKKKKNWVQTWLLQSNLLVWRRILIFILFSVLGDLPSQSLQEVLLHEQENQPNPVGLPGGRGWRGGWWNWTHRQTTLHVIQVSEWQVVKFMACCWSGWWLWAIAKILYSSIHARGHLLCWTHLLC